MEEGRAQEVTNAGGERKSEEMCIHTLGKEDKKQKTEEERQGTKDRGRKDRERKTEGGKTWNRGQREENCPISLNYPFKFVSLE